MTKLSFVNTSLSFDEIKNDFKNHGLVYRDFKDKGLYLLKYNKSKANLTDENIMMCRGLVVDRNTHEIVAIPPIKATHYSAFLEKLDNQDRYIYEEFIDGTNINVFYFNNEWQISTRSSIGANVSFNSPITFRDMFFEVLDFELSNLDTKYCYSFVLLHPNNRIVCNVDSSKLILVEVKEINETGFTTIDLSNFKNENIKFNIPNRYEFPLTLDGYKQAFQRAANSPWYVQGIIVKCLNKNLRTKLPCNKYQYVKALKGNTTNMLERFIVLRKQFAIKEYLKYFPEYSESFNEYEQLLRKFTETTYNLYISVFKKKEMQHSSVGSLYKDLLYNIHSMYISNYKPITFKTVINFIKNKEVEELSYLITEYSHIIPSSGTSS